MLDSVFSLGVHAVAKVAKTFGQAPDELIGGEHGSGVVAKVAPTGQTYDSPGWSDARYECRVTLGQDLKTNHSPKGAVLSICAGHQNQIVHDSRATAIKTL
jgi:hypothetical protein